MVWCYLIRTFVLFIIALETRRVEISGMVQQPDGEWMKPIARNLSEFDDGFLNGARSPIHDRDQLFTEASRELPRSGDGKTEASRAKPRSECLRRTIRSLHQIRVPGPDNPLGARHLWKAAKEYTKHSHFERNHQGLDNERIEKPSDEANVDGECRERLGAS